MGATLDLKRLVYPRPADQLWIGVELAQEVLTKGWRIDWGVEMTEGPDKEARILAVWFAPWDRMIVVKYDRSVPEPVYRHFELKEYQP